MQSVTPKATPAPGRSAATDEKDDHRSGSVKATLLAAAPLDSKQPPSAGAVSTGNHRPLAKKPAANNNAKRHLAFGTGPTTEPLPAPDRLPIADDEDNKSLVQLSAVAEALNDCRSILKEGSVRVGIPGIIVVGEQSSGKSTLLESLIGFAVFPRSKGMCTRSPVVLETWTWNEQSFNNALMDHLDITQMLKTRTFAEARERFLKQTFIIGYDLDEDQTPSRYTFAPEEVTQWIRKRWPGGDAVSEKEIRIKVFSTELPPLALTDLPGIVRVGPAVHDVENMLRKEAANPNNIILAAHSASAPELSTSGGFALIHEYDPDGSRSIIVITRADTIRASSDKEVVQASLSGDVTLTGTKKCNPPYIFAVCAKNPPENYDSEAALLRDSEVFRGIDAPGRLGVPNLRKYLSKILGLRLRQQQGEVRAKLAEARRVKEIQMEQLGSVPVSEEGKLNEARSLLLEFGKVFAERMTDRNPTEFIGVNSLATFLSRGDASALSRLLRAGIEDCVKVIKPLTLDVDSRYANLRSETAPIAFVIPDLLAKCKPILLRTVAVAVEEIVKLITQGCEGILKSLSSHQALGRYPGLRDCVQDYFLSNLKSSRQEMCKFLETMVETMTDDCQFCFPEFPNAPAALIPTAQESARPALVEQACSESIAFLVNKDLRCAVYRSVAWFLLRPMHNHDKILGFLDESSPFRATVLCAVAESPNVSRIRETLQQDLKSIERAQQALAKAFAQL